MRFEQEGHDVQVIIRGQAVRVSGRHERAHVTEDERNRLPLHVAMRGVERRPGVPLELRTVTFGAVFIEENLAFVGLVGGERLETPDSTARGSARSLDWPAPSRGTGGSVGIAATISATTSENDFHVASPVNSPALSCNAHAPNVARNAMKTTIPAPIHMTAAPFC